MISKEIYPSSTKAIRTREIFHHSPDAMPDQLW